MTLMRRQSLVKFLLEPSEVEMGQITVNYKNRGRIFVNGEKRYADQCVDLLDRWILCSCVGGAILEEIFNGSKELDFNIVPSGFITGLEPETRLKSPDDGYALGYKSDVVTGTGVGTRATITLTDTLSVSEAACSSILHVPCDAVVYMRTEFGLMHELVHANRALRGKMRTVSQGDHMKNSEEAIAILITNMLMSEKGAAALRKNYDTAERLDPPDPVLFKNQPGNEALINQVATDHPTLKAKTNTDTAPVPFNPIYAVFHGKP